MNDLPPAVASMPSVPQALMMIDTFASIGATHFDITFKHLSGEQRGFRQHRGVDEVRTSIPYLIASSTDRQNNIIVRPRVEGATCVQLDDLDRQKAQKIAPTAFLMLETSPGSYQAWLAVKDAPLGLTARLRRGIGADLSASGATRVAGTLNFKEKYAPGFPVVRLAARTRGRFATVDELNNLGVLAPDILQVEAVDRRTGRVASRWPDYQRCLEQAPESQSRPGERRGSSADYTFCQMALSWGHSVEATAAKLMEQSGKAQENGDEYALKTARRAVRTAALYNAKKMRP